MNWLQWSTIDLGHGLGGVEVHARSLARELARSGVQVEFSSDPAELQNPKWDVVHTHGSAPGPRGLKSAVRVHTLHGTTLGRMAAAGEWTWPGGYAAALRELRGVRTADAVLAVHPSLWLYSYAMRQGKAHAVCWNGWDAFDLSDSAEALTPDMRRALESVGSFWIYVGRGGDRVKAVERLHGAMKLLPDLRWVAAPGDGFENLPKVLKTGQLSNAQVREVMSMASGLVLCSRYEGNPLVVLEALALGTPVVATKVGAIPMLPEGILGLVTADAGNAEAIADAVRGVGRLDSTARAARAEANRKLLPTWEKVAEIYLRTVQGVLSQRGRAHV